MTEPLSQISRVTSGRKSTRFTLRDDNQQHYHRRVEISHSPLFVELNRRATKESPVHRVGLFRLELPSLLRLHYIRAEREGDDRDVRVRFYRKDDGFIYLQSRLDSPSLRVARAPIPMSRRAS